jgi:hypothetical protein
MSGCDWLKIPIFSQRNAKRIRWENMGFQSQPRIYFVKSQYNTSRGVNWKILRLGKVLLQFTEKGDDVCFDVMHDFVDKLS